MSLRVSKHLLEGQFVDVETAKAYAEWEEKRRKEEEEKKRREEEERRRQEGQRRLEEEGGRGDEERRQTEGEQRREERRQPQSLEEESELVRRRLEEQRRRQEEEERRRREEEERRRREEEERRRREEERRRQEEEQRRREEEQRRREEERRQREEEERRRREEEQRRREEEQRLYMSLEEEATAVRQRLEERRRQQEERHQAQQQPQVASGTPEGDSRGKQDVDRISFDDVVKLLRETGDPKRVVERLREMGLEVEEVADRGRLVQGADYHYGWIVKVGGRYIAITSGHRLGRGDVGDYAAMELPDEGVARNFLIGRYWGTAWGDPDFVRRAAEAAHYERELDRWMREELGKAGYSVERVEWPENAPVRGFTYIIRDSQGNKIGEVQVAKLGFKYSLVNTGLPPAVMASGDPRKAAAYFVYKHVTGDENIAWRLVAGDERAKELYESKLRYEQELKIREQWFRELSERGLKPIAYSKIDGRAVVSENDLFLDERAGVMYRVVIERQGNRIAMKLVPASERDERLLALRSLESEGFRVIDDRTVERDGIRYAVRVEERDGKKMLRLEPEDPRKAAEREVWWELWRQGYVRRGEYAVKDGVRYKVEVEERDGRYVAKLTPVGPASPEEEPRKYRSGDRRGSLEGMKQIQFTVEKLGLERPLTPEELAEGLRFGGRKPRDVSYFPVADEAFYGAFGVPLSQAVFHPAGRELYWRYSTTTLPGPRIGGFTLPERRELERVGETQRLYGERFSDVWTPLTFRAPTERDVSWRTAVATAAEAFTFWIPAAKGAAAFAAARGLRIPVLTTERTATAARGVRLPKVPGDYFEIHYVEPGKAGRGVKAAFVGQGVGEGFAVRGGPGNWEAVLARSAGPPAPGWAFEAVSIAYRDVADWFKKLPSIGMRAEVRPKTVRFTEVRGFAKDLPEPPRFETQPPRGREVKIEWGEARGSPEFGDSSPVEPRGSPGRGLAGAEEVAGRRVVLKTAQVEEELVRPVRVEVPVAQPVRTVAKVAEEVGEVQRVSGEAPAVAPVGLSAPAGRRPPAAERLVEERVVEWPVEVPMRELGYVYIPMWSRDFAAPLTYPFEVRAAEMPAVYAAYETERETARSDVWTAETSSRFVRTAGAQRTADAFPTPPPPAPPRLVRGGYGGGGGSAYMAYRSPRGARRGWRVYELLRI